LTLSAWMVFGALGHSRTRCGKAALLKRIRRGLQSYDNELAISPKAFPESKLMAESQWYNVNRMVHLMGGLRAINEAGSKVTIPIGGNNFAPPLFIAQYHALHRDLISLGLKIVGVDYYESSQQLRGYHPPTWYPFHENQPDKNCSINAEHTWNGLAYAAYKAENIELMDICSRITFEIKACNLRLRQLSEAYNTELWSLCEQQQFYPGKIETLNSFSIYLETHDLLRELCTLRDYSVSKVSQLLVKIPLHDLHSQ